MSDVRLRDVAREAGVHVATASRALNPATRKRVSPPTIERVEDAARRLGYEVNFAARALRTQRSFTIGVLVPDIMRPLYPPIMRGVVDTLDKSGYIALLTGTDEDEQRERRLFMRLRSRGVDGFIMATAHTTHPLLREAAALGVPTVAINRTSGDAPVASVAADNAAGMADIVGHLVALGHRRLANISGPSDTSTGRVRTDAYEAALERHGIPSDPALTVEADVYSIAAGVRAARQLLQGGPSFTAIVTGNDLLALGVLDVLRENRIRCPEQISVVGFNDHPMMDRVTPPLTTVRVPTYEMGAAAARLLLDEIMAADAPDEADAPGEAARVRHVVLPVELIVRASTAPPPAPKGS